MRTTAKPAIRLLVLPNQFFDGELLVGVYAGANDGGSLYTNMGLSHVTLHFEGTSTSITQPSLATFNDANGNPVTYFGWWAKLQKPAGISGEAQLYFEAVPRDTSMQSRVIGPYSFFPHNVFPATGTLHDYELAVAPNQAQIAGQRYTSFANALGFLRNESLSNTLLILFTMRGMLSSSLYVGKNADIDGLESVIISSRCPRSHQDLISRIDYHVK